MRLASRYCQFYTRSLNSKGHDGPLDLVLVRGVAPMHVLPRSHVVFSLSERRREIERLMMTCHHNCQTSFTLESHQTHNSALQIFGPLRVSFSALLVWASRFCAPVCTWVEGCAIAASLNFHFHAGLLPCIHMYSLTSHSDHTQLNQVTCK